MASKEEVITVDAMSPKFYRDIAEKGYAEVNMIKYEVIGITLKPVKEPNV
jgi:hypothetical protein